MATAVGKVGAAGQVVEARVEEARVEEDREEVKAAVARAAEKAATREEVMAVVKAAGVRVVATVAGERVAEVRELRSPQQQRKVTKR